ncbi:MAG: bacteriorhodopsin, partial [Bacteroidota bacterium]
METKVDVERNVDSFLQIGDFVGASFFFSSLALLLTALFLFFQLRHLSQTWKIPVLIATFVPLVAALNSFYRRSYWITTMTDPVEFRFFDWFLTVPLMAVSFYYLLKPIGAKRGMFFRLLVASVWMLVFGYLGEVLQPEKSILWGSVSMAGFAAMVGFIMGEGYPKIFRAGTDQALRKGYLFLSIFLPIG